jgi:hypothetical protein
MDGFFVAKFKVEKAAKVQKVDSKMVDEDEVAMTVDGTAEAVTFDDAEDKAYIIGWFISHQGYEPD